MHIIKNIVTVGIAIKNFPSELTRSLKTNF